MYLGHDGFTEQNSAHGKWYNWCDTSNQWSKDKAVHNIIIIYCQNFAKTYLRLAAAAINPDMNEDNPAMLSPGFIYLLPQQSKS